MLQSFPILIANPGTTNVDTGPLTAILDLSVYAGQSLRLSFDAEVPERFAGLGLLQLDNVVIASAAPPRITAQSAGGVAAVGEFLTLSVQAEGLPPFTFRWQRDGLDVPGGSGNFLNLVNLTPHHTGVYRVRVANAYGEVWRQPIRMSVQPADSLEHPQMTETGRLQIPVAAQAGVRYVLRCRQT